MIKPDEVNYRLAQLLLGEKRLLQPGDNNAKLAKNPVKSWILNLAPHKQNSKGTNLCPHSTPGCQASCLFKAGHGRMPMVEKTRRLNTEVFIQYRGDFLTILATELRGINLKAQLSGKSMAVRLNGTSDVDFIQLLTIHKGINILDEFPSLIFYDYTKSYRKWETYKDTRYRQTFSRSETNWLQCRWVLAQGGSVAVVFSGAIPDLYEGYPVSPGDLTDQRWLDPPGHIIALSYKKVFGDNPEDNPFVVNYPSPIAALI